MQTYGSLLTTEDHLHASASEQVFDGLLKPIYADVVVDALLQMFIEQSCKRALSINER